MKSKSVFVIEDDYSDYHVVGVYDTREKADAVCAVVGGAVSECPMNQAYDEINNGYMSYSVIMLRDGTVENVDREEIQKYNMDARHFIWRRTKAEKYRNTGKQDALNSTVLAKSKEHAIKIVNEKRAQMIANGEWE